MPKRSLTLKAYLALTRGRLSGQPSWHSIGVRRSGPVVWLHATVDTDMRALNTIGARLQQLQPDLQIIRTGVWRNCTEQVEPLPSENAADVEAFLSYWKPAVCVWSGDVLPPALLTEAHARKCSLVLFNVEETEFHTPVHRWLSDSSGAVLQLFDRLFCSGKVGEHGLIRAGVDPERIRRGSRLTETPAPLEYDEAQLDELTGLIHGRPVWLAARVRGDECATVLAAHDKATRLAHRLLLLLVPETEDDGVICDQVAQESGLRVCRWDQGDDLDENTQVLLCESSDELGLWYRLAPLVFLGGSISAGHGGSEPLEAAALGTAIIYGPNVGRHLAAYSRLVDAGAARIVRDTESLSGAVTQLLAPDRAAAMAHAGWDIVSSSAMVADEIVETVQDCIDRFVQKDHA